MNAYTHATAARPLRPTWRLALRRRLDAARDWLAAPAVDASAPTAAAAWLLYHPPGAIRIVTPAESAALDRVRRETAGR